MMGHEGGDEDHCLKEVSFMSLILMLGTLWLGVTLFNFTKTPFLNKVRYHIAPTQQSALSMSDLDV